MPTPPGRRPLAAIAVAAGLAIGALGLIVFLVVSRWLGPPRGALPQGALAPVHGPHAVRVPYERSVLVILYHQVSDHPIVTAHGEDTRTKPFLSPAEFGEQLARFERDGYHTIPFQTYVDFITAKPATLPPKPLLVTFDDGYRSAWTEATPILRKHGMTAVMFIEGARVDQKTPGRLRFDDLGAMERSGVWTIESHGYAGHSDVRTDAAGKSVPYWYANRAWLPDRGRFENDAEFVARLRRDFAAELALIERATGHAPDAFAYPSGEYGENYAGHSDAPDLYPLIRRTLREAGIEMAFATSVPAHYDASSRAYDPYTLPRVGMGELSSVDFAESTDTGYVDIPDLSPQDTFLDTRTIAAAPDGGTWAASSQRPVVFLLDRNGRKVGRWRVEELARDRAGTPTLVSGLLQTGPHRLVIYLQRGVAPNGRPRLVTTRFEGVRAIVERDETLPTASNWMVGIARYHGALVGLSPDGGAYDLRSGRVVARFDHAPDTWSSSGRGRFASLCNIGGDLVAFDRKEGAFVRLSNGGTLRRYPYGGDPELWSCAGTAPNELTADVFVRLHFSLARVQLRNE